MRLGSVKTCKPSVSSLAVALAFRYICPQIYKKYAERCRLFTFISDFYSGAHRTFPRPLTLPTPSGRLSADFPAQEGGMPAKPRKKAKLLSGTNLFCIFAPYEDIYWLTDS